MQLLLILQQYMVLLKIKVINLRRAFSARFTGDDATFAKRKGEISPPFPEVKLNHGDKMDCPTFPEIPI